MLSTLTALSVISLEDSNSCIKRTTRSPATPRMSMATDKEWLAISQDQRGCPSIAPELTANQVVIGSNDIVIASVLMLSIRLYFRSLSKKL